MKEHSVNHNKQYRKLGVMFALHFLAMYILMYAMVHNLTENVFNSVNQLYMAALMTSSMGAIELGLMGSMYPDRKRNLAVMGASIVILFASWFAIRQQIAVGDRQFIRSMIPHHSGAILMCREAKLKDPELRTLCAEIVSSQQREIDQMKSILKRLK